MKKVLVAAAALAAVMFGGSAQAASFSGSGFAIPDIGTASSTFTVGGADVSLSDVNVTLFGLSHTFWNDLDISLSHGGKTVWLTTDNGGSADPNGDYTFDDQALAAVTTLGVSGGIFQSEELLSAFNGMSLLGDWTLTITDDLGADFGNLQGWGITVDGVTSAVPEPTTWAMMIIGFGAVGSMARSSRRKRAPAFA
ncbi:PEPxxWA-CTERM sorting domain-containing protein [Phenylobacterium sp. Root700]|uniref:PEPxxWA-CTERM sorting domain-containing protein n=1 Tax=Phenylobacterium sp. Root700 TaxID=1736591 RepID=UPI0006F3A3DB|nr:PEPxxWA-CTERM sorting domain-containing protein [Phenylobacterium sp. Root700]KRB48919.1 hypothetical protein ASE02_01080 [Phenylobacterium sp. Root700]